MILEKITQNNLTYTIEQDPEPIDPRTEIEQLSRFIFWHKNYKLGDEHTFTPEEFKEMMAERDAMYIPVYMYDHSGITISTTPFSCKWDSGQIGWAYMTREIIDDWFDGDDDKARESIEGEVREYDAYLRGDIYMIRTTNENGETVECLGGYDGLDYAKESLRELLETTSKI